MKKLAWVGILVLLAGGAAAVAMSQNKKEASAEKPAARAEAPAASQEATAKTSKPTDDKKISVKPDAPTIAPVIFGEADAPVVIEEFASLTCPHCAHFHADVLPALEKDFISTKRVQLQWSSFIRNEQDLRGTQLIYCVEDNKKRQQFIKALLQAQDQWAFSADFVNNLRVMAQVGGVSNEQFDKCMADKDLENKLIANRDYGIGLGLDSTPFFVIDKETIKGAREIGMFKAAIEDAEQKK